MIRCFLFLLLLLISATGFAALTETEQNLVTYIRTQKAAQIKLLEELVNINSGTANVAGVRKVGERLEGLFRELGFATHWEELPTTMGHAGTLIAKRQGTKGQRLLLIGHLDTVFQKNSPFQHYQAGKDNAKGPGVIDDKGGLVAILYTLKALQSINGLTEATITVVLTGDEEDSGKPTHISRKAFIEEAKQADIAIDFEPAIHLNSASTGRRGISNWTIETTGVQSHSASIFHEGVGAGAIYEMARILDAFRKEFSNEKEISVNTGILLGGTQLAYDKTSAEGQSFGKQNVIAKKAFAKGDMRFISSAQKYSLETRMRSLLKTHLPNTNASITFENAIPAMAETKNNLKLLANYSAISEELGYGKVTAINPVLKGAGDISHVAAIVPANLAGLGPSGHAAHTVNESIYLPSLTIQTQRAALLIYRLTRPGAMMSGSG